MTRESKIELRSDDCASCVKGGRVSLVSSNDAGSLQKPAVAKIDDENAYLINMGMCPYRHIYTYMSVLFTLEPSTSFKLLWLFGREQHQLGVSGRLEAHPKHEVK